MDSPSAEVQKKITENDPWYTGSYFSYANKDHVKRIYAKRLAIFKKIISREINLKKNISLLDYGCGDGYWSNQFSKIEGCEITGIDYNPLRIERAKQQSPKVYFLEHDLTQKVDGLGKFDIVFCSQVVEHIAEDVEFLMTIQEYLKDDGVLILGTTNEGSWTHRFFRKRHPGQTDHIHFYTESEMRSKIRLAGYKINKIYREVFFPGSERFYNKLLRRDWGFSMLQLMTLLFPSQCSDYYFECQRS